ncbi:MAG: cytochrome-c peroxidase [Myxococcota bacterium]
MRFGFGLGLGVALAALTGCEDVIDLDPVDTRAPIEPRNRPKAISGGTLMVTGDGIAVAADPDRDRIYVVDLDARNVRHSIPLESGDEPGRVVEGSEQRVHVVLRGFGGLATIDRAEGTVLARRWLCPDPRGVAFDPSTTLLHVACADGTLLHMDEATGEPTGRTVLEPDLRDVVIYDGDVLASRFREASIVGEHGVRLNIPDTPGRPNGFDGVNSVQEFSARVAWRTFEHPDGGIAMIHQLASQQPVPIEPPPEDVGDGGDLPYGGGGGSFCSLGLTGGALTRFTPQGVETTPIPDARLAVDAAISPNGQWLAMAMPGVEEGKSSVAMMPPSDGGCFLFDPGRTEEQITAVAFEDDGTLVMQSREPARLLIQRDIPHGSIVSVELSDESRYDTGHEIFHRATESGLSCASCHPEGTDDGHVWVFEQLGKRRTQSLDVGLADSAPFHWDGDMTDLSVLMEEVLAHRMGGKRQSEARRDSFMRWMFEQQRPPADAGRDDPALVNRGRELFASLDCVQCHNGAELGGTMTTPVRNHNLQVPSLHRVSLRPPFMHDGRSPTLDDAVRDMVDSTTPKLATADEVEALSAYMRTL